MAIRAKENIASRFEAAFGLVAATVLVSVLLALAPVLLALPPVLLALAPRESALFKNGFTVWRGDVSVLEASTVVLREPCARFVSFDVFMRDLS